MKIGIIGSGIVGRVLGSAFLSEGYEVMLGTRNTAKEEVVKWKSENKSGKTGSFEETARFGEMLVLASNGLATGEIIKSAGEKNFS